MFALLAVLWMAYRFFGDLPEAAAHHAQVMSMLAAATYFILDKLDEWKRV